VVELVTVIKTQEPTIQELVAARSAVRLEVLVVRVICAMSQMMAVVVVEEEEEQAPAAWVDG
jgi:uncharacterized protein (DUF2336 family)